MTPEVQAIVPWGLHFFVIMLTLLLALPSDAILFSDTELIVIEGSDSDVRQTA
jgi:hypothetical protein